MKIPEREEEKPCAGCGKQAEPEEGLCRECEARLKRLECVFVGEKRDDESDTEVAAGVV